MIARQSRSRPKNRMDGKSVDKTGLLAFPLNFEPVPKARTGIRLPSLRGMAGTDIININSTNYGARTQQHTILYTDYMSWASMALT